MALSSRDYGDARVLAPTGRLDHDNCETFWSELVPHLDTTVRLGHTLVLDLAGLEYVSSAGLRCLMLASREARAHNGRVLFAAMQPVVAEIFRIGRFNLLFEAFPTLRDALASVSPRAVEAFGHG